MPFPKCLAVAFLGAASLSAHGQRALIVNPDNRPISPDTTLVTTKHGLARSNSVAPISLQLFNGKDFTGWDFCMKNGADPAKTWSVTNGVIHCNGAAVGYLRTTTSHHDYRLTVEWRFTKMAPKADNTGILVHIQPPDKVWPQCVQVQGKHDHLGDLFLMSGAESKEHRSMDANVPLPLRGGSAEKPIGEWNICETVCSGNSVQTFINGRLLNETSGCTVSNGMIGIQSEGADFEIRKIILQLL
ncbi:MAG TPA: DUF1080 domain-containing protein [Candidatus Paceibacterota bacterium]|nr:DUF1080 domain-containing protein [Candidatus Paceibacterota bacterium]